MKDAGGFAHRVEIRGCDSGGDASGNTRGTPGDASPDSSGSSAIYTSLQRLGLRLDRRKLPVELIVIDHLEKTPTEN